MPEIECKLSKILMSETNDHQVIYLKEKGGPRYFPIMIGIFEVFAIHRIINKEPPPRPLTHELIGNIFEALSVEVERVVVNDLVDGTFYARLVLGQNGRSFEVDSRPSDAITLAVQRNAPIFVEEHVLDEVARTD
jgi:bifunctional DNase/RNase